MKLPTRLVIAFGLLLPSSLPAQQPTGATLTLGEALAITRKRNPEYRQALNRVYSASAQVSQGFGNFLPTLSAGLAFNGSQSRRVTGEDDFGRPISLAMPINFRGSTSSQWLSAGVTVFDGFANLNTYKAAKASQLEADVAADATVWRLEAETKRRFYDVLRAERLVELEQRLLKERRDQLANTERLFRAAAATPDDVLGAQADVANQELESDRARGDERKARLALKEQMGVEEDIAFRVADELPTVFDPAALQGVDLVALALETSPAVQQLVAPSSAAGLRASAVRGSRWPTIQLNARVSRSVSLSSYDALLEFDPKNRTFQFGLSLDWPLFTGFRTRSQVATADVDARNAHEALRSGQLSVERAVRSAYIDLQNAYRSLELAQRSAELSSERMRLARERYAIAAIDFTALQQVILLAAQADRQFLDARFGFVRAVVNLEEAVGQPVRP